MPMVLEIKSPKNDCRRFFSTFANFEKNKNRQTFWTCISKTTHPKVSFGKIKWNLIFLVLSGDSRPLLTFALKQAVGLAASVCLRNRSQFMNGVQLLISIFGYHSNWMVRLFLFIHKLKLSFNDVIWSSEDSTWLFYY